MSGAIIISQYDNEERIDEIQIFTIKLPKKNRLVDAIVPATAKYYCKLPRLDQYYSFNINQLSSDISNELIKAMFTNSNELSEKSKRELFSVIIDKMATVNVNGLVKKLNLIDPDTKSNRRRLTLTHSP